jgi:hypothetical protein
MDQDTTVKPEQPAIKKPYASPELREWGTLIDLTRTGRTMPGLDAKGGSAMSRGR